MKALFRPRLSTTLPLLAALLAGRAIAAPITSAGDPAFGAHPVTVDFESTPAGIYPAFAGGLPVPTPAGIVTFNAPRLQITGTYAGQYNMTGSQYLSSEGYLFRNLDITFPTPVHAFGMNVGLTSQPWDLYAYDAAGNVIETITIPATLGSNAGDFFGISSATEIAEALLVVHLPLRPGPLWVVVDNVTFDTASVELAVTKGGHGAGTVASTPAGIDCGATCSAPFGLGDTATLTATPAAGSFFGGWSNACTGAGTTTTVTLAGATQCNATFHLFSESADLRVGLEQTPSRPRRGRKLTYRIAVENEGPAIATAAGVTIALTGIQGSDLATIKASSGCTVTGAGATCALGDLGRSRRKLVSIAVIPSAIGPVGATATATSAAPDPTPADAVASLTSVVR